MEQEEWELALRVVMHDTEDQVPEDGHVKNEVTMIAAPFIYQVCYFHFKYTIIFSFMEVRLTSKL